MDAEELKEDTCKSLPLRAIEDPIAQPAKKYISPDGFEFESYEAYCNSDFLDIDEIMIKLDKGERTPQNETEQRILEELEEIHMEGGIVDYTVGSWYHMIEDNIYTPEEYYWSLGGNAGTLPDRIMNLINTEG